MINLNLIKTVNDFNFYNKIALIRVDFNIPINPKNFHILDDTRIKSSIPTIKKVLYDNGKVILLSHFGRPKGKYNKNYSIKFLIPYLYKKLKVTIKFSEYCIGPMVEQLVLNLKNKEVMLLENLRFYQEEEDNNKLFAFQLSKLGDIYVNDAFGSSHRFHASITTLPKLFVNRKCIGFLMEKEIKSLNKFLGTGKQPISVLLGGSKINSKIKIIKNLVHFADHILIGGGMAYPFIKILGGQIGDSLTEKYDKKIETELKSVLENNHKKIFFPKDVIIVNNNEHQTKIVSINSIPHGWKGLDIGPESINFFCTILKQSKTILWNGPFGVFEQHPFYIGTQSIAKFIVELTIKNNCFSLVGGGDSIAALKMIQLENKVSYISTGGGALLESLQNTTLPGIQAFFS
ncbi:phosphoglycerate kinase [Blattabacterium cuenoti]|uniref:phosphoglycerate kinase n=1 Tax=Blattabacterium cuenoti TaxID=1653831 RepID=UPI00163CF5A5|nr:phosphoglycerate kinase [Blattabacterium cuenoti]